MEVFISALWEHRLWIGMTIIVIAIIVGLAQFAKDSVSRK
jgi:hypothetical protein